MNCFAHVADEDYWEQTPTINQLNEFVEKLNEAEDKEWFDDEYISQISEWKGLTQKRRLAEAESSDERKYHEIIN